MIQSNIEIISTRSYNSVSINLSTLEVTQIIRFASGNTYKDTTPPCRNLAEARAWAALKAAER